MDERTRTALEGSIKKWEGIVNGIHQDMGSLDCPLCKQFCDWDAFCGIVCTGCPVAEKVKQHGCKGTPYFKFSHASTRGGAISPKAIEAAKRELDFLKSLRDD